ncbi:CHAT domain-containing protein [bacterium]|nr:CHAT domain-containing protein [bacterium]
MADIQAAIDLLEALRQAAPAGELRQTYFASVQDYYQFYLDLLMDLHQQQPERGYDAQALAASESARARTLLDLLSEAGADIRQGVPAALLQREKDLRQQISAREKQRLELASTAATAPQAEPLKAEIDQLLQQQRQLEAEIRATSPAYAAIQYPTPLTAQQIQQQVLDPNTLLLQYALGDEQSYLWAVTPDSLQVHILPGRDELTAAVQRFRRATTGPSSPGSLQAATDPLSQLLLGPVADQLPGKRLLIVPDGALHFLPFAALSDPNQPDAPLVANHELVSAAATSALASQRQTLSQRTPAPKALALLADPVFTADDPRFPAGVRQPDQRAISGDQFNLPSRALRALDRLSRLPGTRAEAEQILALLPDAQTRSALDFDANYNFATATDLSQYQIVHLATHGFFNPQNPELSGIILSLFDASGRPQPNGFLTLNDIFNLNLPAELVVLSACQTGQGDAIRGEGLVGLTRGLMYAGAERAVVSLWAVDDEATAALMVAFYEGILQDDLTPAAALRQAQEQIRQQEGWEHPYYWAAFTLQGEWRP